MLLLKKQHRCWLDGWRSSLIWVFTVCPDLSVWKQRIIMTMQFSYMTYLTLWQFSYMPYLTLWQFSYMTYLTLWQFSYMTYLTLWQFSYMTYLTLWQFSYMPYLTLWQFSYMTYLTLWDQILLNLALLETNSYNILQISQNFQTDNTF